MSTNAFYQAFGALGSALGDPRAEADERRRREAEMQLAQSQNAMAQARFRAEQEAQERVRLQGLSENAMNRARFGFRTQSMYPGGAPQQPQAMLQAQQMPLQGQPQQIAGPMPQQAALPAEQAAQPPQMQRMPDGSMREVEQVEVTAMRPPQQQEQMRGPAPSQEDEITFLMRDAFERSQTDPNAMDQFNQLFDLRRSTMTAEEKRGREIISGYAGQILRMPAEQRGQAVMMAMEQLGIDPASTKIDDYVNDPVRLEQALRFEMVMGAPEDAAKQGIKTQGSFDEFRPYERDDSGSHLQAFDPRTGAYSEGPRKSASPDTVFAQREQTKREAMGNAAQIQVARISDAGRRWAETQGNAVRIRVAAIQADSAARVAAISANTRMSEGEKNRAIQREALNLKRRQVEMGMPEGAEADMSGGADGIVWDN